ncbi:threonine/serine dehydratase [uncultured Alsobacter sp.]|uniref:threonine ammonia-lyase n=1 Tax=uncultured Alsobacter sp. TaxID=1748258 RepID=UPI0025FCBF4F|nr:pyridoxal-phosphate dependent enzyme [uncultured Alsobacter sp.]
MTSRFDVTLADVEAAASRIAGHVRRTPSWRSPALSERLGREVVVKLECLQLAGSFKVRGVANRLMMRTPQEMGRGVVAVSGGNHAIAVARGAAAFGVPALVLMPRVTARFNIDATAAFGATIELVESAAEAFAKADALSREGWINLHAFDDPAIIAGNGTVGLEFIDAHPELTHLFASIGGGGFIAGIAAAAKGRKPTLSVHGVETEGAETMTRALAAGEPVTISPTSIARTLGAPFVTHRTLAAATELLSAVDVVPDATAVVDMRWLLQAEKVLCEPAAACTVSAAMRRAAALPEDAVIGLVLCGSNIALADVEALCARFAA